MRHLEHAKQYRPTKRESDQLHFDRFISYAEAAVMRCSADPAHVRQAAVLYKEGLELTKRMGGVGGGGGGGDSSSSKHAVVTKLNALVEVLGWTGQHAEARAVSKDAALLAGWPNHALQRPTHHFDRSLEGSGWREGDALAALGKGVAGLIAVLEAGAPALKAEYASLRKRKLLRRQTECLHVQPIPPFPSLPFPSLPFPSLRTQTRLCICQHCSVRAVQRLQRLRG